MGMESSGCSLTAAALRAPERAARASDALARSLRGTRIGSASHPGGSPGRCRQTRARGAVRPDRRRRDVARLF